jgi:hypothetical protein
MGEKNGVGCVRVMMVEEKETLTFKAHAQLLRLHHGESFSRAIYRGYEQSDAAGA